MPGAGKPRPAAQSGTPVGGSRWRSRTEYDYLLKLVIVGDEGCGKSSVMNRFCEDTFSPSYVATIGVDFKVRTVLVDVEGTRCTVKMQMWDTAGQERFSSITTSFYRGADAVFVMYDLTSRHSFNRVGKWLKGCTDVCGQEVYSALVANKLDLADKYREVPTADGVAMAAQLGMPHYEISAKADTNVDDAFREVAAEFAARCIAKRVDRHTARTRARVTRAAQIAVAPAARHQAEPGCWAWLKALFAGRPQPQPQPHAQFGGGGIASSHRAQRPAGGGPSTHPGARSGMAALSVNGGGGGRPCLAPGTLRI